MKQTFKIIISPTKPKGTPTDLNQKKMTHLASHVEKKGGHAEV
jgi:hypothetical protein